MSRTQWIVIAASLAVIVFVVTFAMNYLGGRQTNEVGPSAGTSVIDVTLLTAQEAPVPWLAYAQEGEEKEPNHRDYWLANLNSQGIKIGLTRRGCQCSAVEVSFPPSAHQARLWAATVGGGSSGPLGALTSFCSTLGGMQNWQGIDTYELKEKAESAPVPSGAMGWLRLRWKHDKSTRQHLDATIWVDNPKTGKTSTLGVRVVTYEPMRMVAVAFDGMRRSDNVSLGLLRDEDLEKDKDKGVTRYIYCWSSTRDHFKLQARRAGPRGPEESDPFVVGPPERLTKEEMVQLMKENNSNPDPAIVMDMGQYGPVRSGYKVPVHLKALSEDKSTPFEVGLFYRAVALSSPDVPGEPKILVFTGRVLGVVDIGSDYQGAEINFRAFASKFGAREKMPLQSTVPGLKLRFDRQRTPKFLNAKLSEPVKGADNRQSWTLQVEAIKGQVRGPFPRRGDQLYQDSAVYLQALEPGRPPRSIRIPTVGTATEG
jgi:hypothetical protein